MVSPRVVRGGSWFTHPGGTRSAFRCSDDAAYRDSGSSFRLVMEPESRHILRGGSLISIARIARAGSYYTIPYNRTPCLGFRLVREPK